MIKKIIVILMFINFSVSFANEIFNVDLGKSINNYSEIVKLNENGEAYKVLNYKDFNLLSIFYTPKTNIISRIATIKKIVTDCEKESEIMKNFIPEEYNNKSYHVDIYCKENTILTIITEKNLEKIRNKELDQINYLTSSLITLEKEISIFNIINKDNNLNEKDKLSLLREYRDNVYELLYSNWEKPIYANSGWECKIHINQKKDGTVVNVKFIKCQNDNDFKNSIKNAILKSSPLPLPKHNSLFNDILEVKFKVKK